MEFIPVAGEDQPKAGVDLPAKGDDAHAPFWRVRVAECIHVLHRNMPRTPPLAPREELG